MLLGKTETAPRYSREAVIYVGDDRGPRRARLWLAGVGDLLSHTLSRISCSTELRSSSLLFECSQFRSQSPLYRDVNVVSGENSRG